MALINGNFRNLQLYSSATKQTSAKKMETTLTNTASKTETTKGKGTTEATEITTTEQAEQKPAYAPYRGNGNWGKAVERDLNRGRLHEGDHINVTLNGRLYRFVITCIGNGVYSSKQVPFENGKNSVPW